jgi:signal transduction histidine kinase
MSILRHPSDTTTMSSTNPLAPPPQRARELRSSTPIPRSQVKRVPTGGHAARLIAAFVIVAAVFVGSTVYADHLVSSLEDEISGIRGNALPSIIALNDVRQDLHRYQDFAERLIPPEEGDRATLLKGMADARRNLDTLFAHYREWPSFPEEPAVVEDYRRTMGALDETVEKIKAMPPNATDDQRAAIRAQLFERHEAVERSMFELVTINATNGVRLASEIEDVRVRARRTAVVLDFIALLVAAAAAAEVVRSFRRYRVLVEEHERLLQERAAELEAFSARVSHDILSPLSATALALDLAERRCEDAGTHVAIARGRAAVTRVKSIVDALLEFARSGAKPSQVGRARIAAVANGLAEERRFASSAVDVSVDVPDDLEVACSEGVLTSLLANLLNNAVRYMGDASVREVLVRAEPRGNSVYCEVCDTGPGVAPDRVKALFLPQVGAMKTRGPGLGLGLATVKRLAEAHGGQVGYEPRRGGGSIFWVELPRAYE